MQRSDFPLLHRQRTRFIEVDRQGIVHNAHYLAYFGIALNEYYRMIDYDRVAINDASGTALHVVSASVEYRMPLTFDEEIEIGARIAKLGRTSVTFEYGIFKLGVEAPAAFGQQVWVHTDKATHKGTPWPEDFVSLIERTEGERLAR